jgi:hypothetical protein
MSEGKDYVVFNENVYYLTDIEDYTNLELGKYIAAEGVVDDKPVVSNLPSIKPFEVSFRGFTRYNVWTELLINGIASIYYGPLHVKKGEKLKILGKKTRDELVIHKAETDEIIYQNY